MQYAILQTAVSRTRDGNLKELTTTSYALLGLLAVQPWSAYELTGQMQRGWSLIWPRAERAIYDEPKNLVAHGLARAAVSRTGRRRRTTYSITEKGRRALRRWLSEPAIAPPIFESEALVKLSMAQFGTKEDAVRALDNLEARAKELRAIEEQVLGGYLDAAGPFPERVHLIVLVGKFLHEYRLLLSRYAEWARGTISAWDGIATAEAFPGAAELMRTLLTEGE
jgi:DNA-binding PadR family transcriptional regulator